MNELKRGTRCKVAHLMQITLDGDTITLYDDNLGDEIEIINKEFDTGVITWYNVRNLTKGYEQYAPSSILEIS